MLTLLVLVSLLSLIHIIFIFSIYIYRLRQLDPAMEIQQDIQEVKVTSATCTPSPRRSPIALLKSICVIVVLVLFILQGGVVLMGIEGTAKELGQLKLYLEQVEYNRSYRDAASSPAHYEDRYRAARRAAYLSCELAKMDLTSWDNISTRDALLYSTSIMTTIGWGVFYPRSQTAKLVTMIYALLGIPLAATLIGQGVQFLAAAERACMEHRVIKKCVGNPKILLTAIGILFGMLLILVGCEIMTASTHYSGVMAARLTATDRGYPWSSVTGMYYTFVTVLTIGFGDEYLYMDSATVVLEVLIKDVIMFVAITSSIIYFSHCLNKLSAYFDDRMDRKLRKVVWRN